MRLRVLERKLWERLRETHNLRNLINDEVTIYIERDQIQGFPFDHYSKHVESREEAPHFKLSQWESDRVWGILDWDALPFQPVTACQGSPPYPQPYPNLSAHSSLPGSFPLPISLSSNSFHSGNFLLTLFTTVTNIYCGNFLHPSYFNSP